MNEMEEQAYIRRGIEALEESVRFFSNPAKPERERWVCTQFFATLRVPFEDADIHAPAPEPADVMFGTDAFQVKEICDDHRPRQKEYRRQLAVARAATSAKELQSEYAPLDLTMEDACALVFKRLEKLNSKYAPEDRAKTNLLLYINLKERFFAPGPLPDLGSFAKFGWRSIGMLLNDSAIVLYAAADAPVYLAGNAGRFVSGVSR